MALQDDGQAAGDDLLDITVDTPFDRSTDQIVRLNFPFNIDNELASHFYDGSVSQGLDASNILGDLWSGLEVIGPVVSGTEYMILQAGRVLVPFWGTGINPPGGASSVFSRHLVKSVEGGAKIDGQRIVVLSRTLGNQYRRFPVTLGTANSVAAIAGGLDIFNETADATIAGWTTITNVEGFQEIDIDGTGAAGQEFYSQWNIGSQSVNDTTERAKWISQNGHEADSTQGSPTGANFIVEDASIIGQAQSFIPLTGDEFLTEARFNLKTNAGTPTGFVYAELWDSDDASPGVPTGGALARSEDIPIAQLTSTYAEVIFKFNRKDPTGVITAQQAQLVLDNAEYYIVLRHDAGDGSNNIHVEGASSSVDATMDRAEDTGSWAGSATSDLDVTVKSSPEIHGITGETIEGISVEVAYDGETGTEIALNDIVNWGTELVIDTVTGTWIEGEHVRIFANGGSVVKNGGQVLFTNNTTEMILALDDITSNLLDNDDLVGVTSGATAKIATTITNQDKAGGTGLVLARDDNSPAGELYLQLITGVNPVENIQIYKPGDVANFVDATGVINSRTIIPEFMGQSTGTNVIGAYGIGFEISDVNSSDKFISLDNAPRTPENTVVFTVSGLVSGEDRVLVGPRSGTALDKAQMATDVTLSGATEAQVQTDAAIPAGTPKTGTGADNTRLRVELDSGIYRIVQYDSITGQDFDITTGPDDDWTGNNISTAPKDAFIAYIDVLADAATETFTAVHTTNVDLLVRVRDGGTAGDGIPTKEFQNTAAQFLATPQTVAATRNTDA